MSGYQGVSWHKRDEKWEASIWQEGKRKSLGEYADKKDAAKAWDDATRTRRGIGGAAGRAAGQPGGRAAPGS